MTRPSPAILSERPSMTTTTTTTKQRGKGVCGRAMVSRGFEPLTGGRPARRDLPLECIEALLRLLSIPLKSLGLGVLSLAEYIDLLHFLPWESQKQVKLRVGTIVPVFFVCVFYVCDPV